MGVLIIGEDGEVEYDSEKNKPSTNRDDREHIPFPPIGYVEPGLVPVSSEVPHEDKGGWHPGLGDISEILPK